MTRRRPTALVYTAAACAALIGAAAASGQQPEPPTPEPASREELHERLDNELARLMSEFRDGLDAIPQAELNLLTLQWENDSILHVFVGPDIDRGYTNGLSGELSLTPNDAFYDTLIEPFDVFDEFNRPEDGAPGAVPRSAVGGMLRHAIYTPEDITTTLPQPNDTPYGGLLTLGVFVQRTNGLVFDHTQLDIGYIGQNSGAQALQEWVHAWLPNQGDPSWVNQTASGLAVVGTYQRRWKLRWQEDESGRVALATSAQLSAESVEPPSGFELIPYAGVRVGNVHDDLAFGTLARWGWPLPDDFGPSRVAEFTDHTRRGREGVGFSVFARGGARLVARNALYEGNILGGDRRLEPKPLVGELQLGVQLEWNGCLLSYTQAITTDEFEGQQAPARVGTFAFTYNFAH
ncbi:MAG: lipid A deacylase LpxR family protein [Phycisphaerales bacterium]